MKKRTIINKQLWHSFIALTKYFFRSLNADRVSGVWFFTETTYQDFKQRIESLNEDTPAKWGTMRVEQMLHHVNLSIGSGQGLYNLPDESYFLSRTLFKWIVIDLYMEQPKGLRLPLCMSIKPDAKFNFETERRKLLAILDIATMAESQSQWMPHCYFGKLSVLQWGKLCSMHLDYHLKQFSA